MSNQVEGQSVSPNDAKPVLAARLPKIFCFINGQVPGLGDYEVCALAEDGECVAGHISSSEYFAKHDIGISSDWKHEKYKEKYPAGYELVWLSDEDCRTNGEFITAVEKANGG